ncbi:MAG: membrane protein insertase YidC [Endomicrobium sp.]|jgi:YidC/Oxa1 family membrane protein insertase|nr:membrane protein insertase YidC [Endomicrobium sp.]
MIQKNSILFIILSALTIFVWFFFIVSSGKPYQQFEQQRNVAFYKAGDEGFNKSVTTDNNVRSKDKEIEQIVIKTKKYRVSLTNDGASILSWAIKEKNGKWVDLVFSKSAPVMSNFHGLIYNIVAVSDKKVVFEYISPKGWKIIKTYNFSDSYMHNLDICIERLNETLPSSVCVEWGPGLGTDNKELKENTSLTRVLACSGMNQNKLKKLKNISDIASIYKWVAIDNRYFLVAFIPDNPMDFNNITAKRFDKKSPYSIVLEAKFPEDTYKKNYSVNFYVGPKDYSYLKTYGLGLEKTIDFGFFGILGKSAFTVLVFLHKITNNYGWAIVALTAIIQVLVFPLTLKSFKSTAAMKQIQPIIKNIQTKYKNNPQRLKIEMLNVYRIQKINPLSGCLPMLLQLPIFWAFFTMLRNTYELRNEKWIFWIRDLSAPDRFINLGSFTFNLLPLIMGIGMFLQQKMNTTTSDPTQKKIAYVMPVVFTFMFWSFPSGLVLYWLTNSIISITEQYFILKKRKYLTS